MKSLHIYLLLLFCLGLNTLSQAQTENSKLYYKFGIGSSFSGSGDVVFYEISNSLNYTFSPYLTGEVSINNGTAIGNLYTPSASLIRTDLNAIISLLNNKKVFDFRVGGGISYQYSPRTFVNSYTILNGEIQDITYTTEIINTPGFNSIVELVTRINKKSKLSVTGRLSYYGSIDINSGVSITLYRRL